MSAKDYMALTPNDRKQLVDLAKELRRALRASDGESAAAILETAQNRLRLITQGQWWRTR